MRPFHPIPQDKNPMLKNLSAILAFAAAGLAFAASPAHARDWYVKAEVGQASNVSAGPMSLENGLTFGGAVGTSVGPVRVEAGASRVNTGALSVVDITATAYSATAYLDLPMGLYAGAGLDYLTADANVGFAGTDLSGDGWHWSAGYAHRISPNMIAEAQFTRLDGDMDSVSVAADRWTVGVRIGL